MPLSRRHILRIAMLAALLSVFSFGASAQFKDEAFNQNYNSKADTTALRDSVDKMFSFKEFFHGVATKDSTLKIRTMFGGSTVFVGSGQIYNRQAWKLPIIYGGLGTTLGLGFHYRGKYLDSKSAYDAAIALDPNSTLALDTKSRKMATYMFAGAGLIYWGTLMDEVVNYKKDKPCQAGKATIYSILVPGLGQCYNGEFWKVPIYWGGMIGSLHYYSLNRTNYLKYKRIYNEATSPEGGYQGRISAETALYYRDVFRRYRDYSVVAIAGFYLLQVIDANVFAYMRDFEVDDDISLKISPAVIPANEYAISSGPASSFTPSFSFGAPAMGRNAVGMKIGLRF